MAVLRVPGGELYYEAEGDGVPVVLVHGLALDARMWDEQVPALTDIGRVVRYDVRGFGRSARDADTSYSHAGDLWRLLDHLQIDQAVLVGLSMGGRVVVEATLTAPERVLALVLLDAVLDGVPWDPDSERGMRAIGEALRTGGLEEAKAAWLRHDFFVPAERMPDVARRLAEMVGDYSGVNWTSADPHAPHPNTIELLATIAVPTTVVSAELDVPGFHEMSDVLAERIAGARKVTVPGVGHMVNMEAPEAVNALLREVVLCALPTSTRTYCRGSDMAWSEPGIRRDRARALRAQVPRSSHAAWTPSPGRRDPVLILREQEAERVPELVPIRHERMLESPFTFFRGAAAVMAEDLASTPVSGLRVQACGDAHLLNFGVYATPERRLMFDVNDFDETLPAPFEWDVKRLAASVAVAARTRGFTAQSGKRAARAAATAYRTRIAQLAQMGHLEVWYSRLDVDELLALMHKTQAREARKLESGVRKARAKTSLGALDKLTEVIDGQRRIVDSPPLIEHLPERGARVDVPVVVRRYRTSLADETRAVLERYRPVDWARKVVGVGSVGTDDAIVLLRGDSDRDPLFLQVKEAQASVLERFAGRSRYRNHGQRVVAGQRLTQAASDIFLGWTGFEHRDYYVRQLRDMKGSVSIDRLSPEELTQYARACGEALAGGHARSGDRVAISAYLGRSDAFDRAVAEFAVAYSDQTDRDHASFADAVGSGDLTRASV